MRYTQLTEDQVQHMLKEIGENSIEDLFRTIPSAIRAKEPLKIPKGLSELELMRDVQGLADRNNDCRKLVCFLGAGAYDHFVPTVVDAMASQSEFVTAYTPYQAEASQGALQLFYEFQTMICELTGMEVANASLYEGATAAAEAVMMATGITRRNVVVVAGTPSPDTVEVLRTYASQRGVELVMVPSVDGVVDESALESALSDKVAAVLVQSPNFFGLVERLDRIIPKIQAAGALAIVSADPIASGMLKTPGELGADIVVGEGQGLGVPMLYGGPYIGIMATRQKYLRKMPGRVIGMTKDLDGRRGFCLALQTREQHIKRERATSNVCTNQGLIAIRVAIHLAWLGTSGLKEVARHCFDKAHYAAEQIAKLDGYEIRFPGSFFKEFVVRTTRGVDKAMAACRAEGLLAGVPMKRFFEDMEDCFMVAVTEKRTKSEIDALVDALGKV